jgi:IS30 family transposase
MPALRPKRCLLALHVKLQEIVAGKLILDWSPEQISGWLKTEYPEDESMRVSRETIYRSLFIQARGVLKKELIQHLRFKRRIRRSRHARDSGHRMGQIVDAISIRERPAEIADARKSEAPPQPISSENGDAQYDKLRLSLNTDRTGLI